MEEGKQLAVKAGLSVALTGLAAYFQILLVPMLVLILIMLCDYITGILVAWSTGTLCSKAGMKGIVRKLGYFFVVCIGGGVDWLLQSGLKQVGLEVQAGYTIGTMVLIWLIINEMLSVLENLTALGVPLPGFLKKIVEKLKVSVDDTAEEPKKNELSTKKND